MQHSARKGLSGQSVRGRHCKWDSKKKMCKVGFVTQADYLLPYLTVTETITFAAKLKVQQKEYNSGTADLLTALVNNLILELGLSECANTMIGDDAATSMLTAKRGISGGEKRRVSVALQIISNPESNTYFSSQVRYRTSA